MDREIEALRKAREHVADIAALAKAAEEHLEEGRFEDAPACLHLIEQHAALGRENLGPRRRGSGENVAGKPVFRLLRPRTSGEYEYTFR